MQNELTDQDVAFIEAFARLIRRGRRVRLSLDPLTAWTVMASLQLATRHPANDGQTRAIAERVARRLELELLGPTAEPILRTVAEAGWRAECDR